MKGFLISFIFASTLTLAVARFTVPLMYDSGKAYHPLSDQMIKHINQLKPQWKAGRNFHVNTSMAYIRRLMGTYEEPWYLRLPMQKPHSLEGLHIPAEFDARVKWANCASIKEIRDQGGCGSCWAFSATETMTDRYCIFHKGLKQFRFSADNLVGCCRMINFCGMGCNGGFLATAWRYYEKTGIVSGGPYGSNQGCQPYEIEPCEHHTSGPRPQCSVSASTPGCKKQCEPGYSISYNDDLHLANDTYSVSSNEQQIQVEIMKNGPVSAAFLVYNDFLSYKAGVYHHVAGGFMGGHAIKIIGWGEEAGTPYWTVANSWNYDFGEKGFFRIRRGHNECRIESSVRAGIPRVDSE